MAKKWEELRDELVRETDRIFTECPDEIKRFHYGLITHSDAGKHALGQYFGHWVHNYAAYMMYSSDTLDAIRRLARNPTFELKQLIGALREVSMPTASENNFSLLIKYGGQRSLGTYVQKTLEALPSLETKEEFLELLGVFQSYVSRLYWWFHWYFPWGVGPALCPRRSPEDVKEMVRLSQM